MSSLAGLTQGLHERVSSIEQGEGPWRYVADDEFQNGWTNAGPPFSNLAYRRGIGPQEMKFKGHLLPGSSDTVAFTVDADYLGDFTGDQTWLTDIVNGGGFSVARVYLDVTTGDVTITFPAT